MEHLKNETKRMTYKAGNRKQGKELSETKSLQRMKYGT